ncbi:3'-5' exonuclease [Streptomyces sp. V4I2]|uniref:3'-5' exonuclease n=1 Tax=Streptomyces sp. V4I2 TaxID=3042280 RepID=UPI0027D8F132|nr:3'-5' exonuclease [Streptomyces sp. V4I2]
MALYRLADVRAVRDMPGVDWEAVKGLPKGTVSPLREYAALAPTRAAVVKTFAQGLADRYGTTVWAWNSPYSGGWELDWERVNGAPTKDAVRRELLADPAAAAYASEITLCPAWGEVTRIARELLQPDAAVILDTETTDLPGQTVELAVIDAATGKKLMDTLVKPTEPISDGARWVHGITDEMVARARQFEKILPRLRQVTKGKVICAYNADFDRGVVLGDVPAGGEEADAPGTLGLLVLPHGGVQGLGRLLPVAAARRPPPRPGRLRICEEGVDPDVQRPWVRLFRRGFEAEPTGGPAVTVCGRARVHPGPPNWRGQLTSSL